MRWEAMIPALKQAYHTSFYDPEAAVYGDGTPTAFATALWLGVCPPDLLPKVVANFEKQIASVNYTMVSMGFIGVRYVFEALAKVNRTDVALRMLHQTAHPSFGWQITNSYEPATSLWESYDAPTMHQWVDESSRDHHYSASINTALRKTLAGLDMPSGQNAWSVVKCRPTAAHWPHMLPSASAVLESRRGLVGCSWSATEIAPAPPPPSLDLPSVYCAMSTIFTGAVSGPAPMIYRCPKGETISKLEYARWGNNGVNAIGPNGWYCFGKQPPPHAACEVEVSAKLSPLCIGKNSCDLSLQATTAALGDPCSPPLPKNSCPAGQHIDYVDLAGDNGSCDCKSFCASAWNGVVKTLRPHWTGATALVANSTKSCRCVQATHWCPKGTSCTAVCKTVGQPTAKDICVSGPIPAPPPNKDLALIVRVSCSGTDDGRTPGQIADVPLEAHLEGSTWATVNATVPGGSRGEVHVPILNARSGSISESGTVVWRNGKFATKLPVGVRGGGNDGRFVSFETGPGSYSFSSTV